MPAARASDRTRSALVAADLLRLVAAVSVVAGLMLSGTVAGALFLLVLGGAMLARALDLPSALDVCFCATILLGAWAAVLDWYVAVGWLDVVVHAAATGLVAAVAHVALVRTGALTAVDEPGLRRPRLGCAIVTAALGVTLATLWELGEWFGHTYLDDRIQVGYADTVGDLAAGTAGAVVAAVLLSGPRR